MSALRIESTDNVFASSSAGHAAARLLARAEVMGLLGNQRGVSRLDVQLLETVLQRLRDIGLVQAVAIGGRLPPDSAHLAAVLDQINDALEHSPLPDKEWPGLRAILGDDLLIRLCGISLASLRRYAGGQRATPDAIAQRLHTLALIIADLRGAYNDYGVRRWFQRPRAQLDGHTPLDVLPPDWSPEDADTIRLRELAAALTASSAT